MNTEKNIKPVKSSRLISIATTFKEIKNNIKSNTIFKFTFWAIFIKTIFFILLISDGKAVKIDIIHAFYSAPPILVYVSFVCIFLSFAYLFKGNFHAAYYIFIDILLTVIYIGDIWYYRSNSCFLNYYMLNMTSNLNNLEDSVFAMFRPVDLVFIIDIVILIFLSIKKRPLYKTFKRSFSCFLALLLIPLIYLGYAHEKVDKLHRAYENQILFAGSWTPNQTMSSLTPIGYHLFELYDYIKEYKPCILTSKEKSDIKNWYKDKGEVLPPNEYKGMFKGKNVIVLQVESLENFVINQKVNGQEITPNLNKLLNNSFYFNNFHEQTYNGTTSDAELIANTSLFPIRKGTTFFRYGTNTYTNSMPNIMKSLNYNTLATHPDNGSYWNWYIALKSMGFQKCLDSTAYKTDETIGLGISDGSYLRQLSDIIGKEPQPFYSFSITLKSHTPFILPDKYKNLNLSEDIKNTELGKYFQCVSYTDKQIGMFLDRLDKKGILDNSIVVIYGDHEGVHKFFDDEINSMKNKEPWWINNDKKIPLFIYSKNMQGKTISTIGGQADLLPTLSYLLDVPSEKYTYTSMGRNLLNTKLNYVILSNKTYEGTASSEEEKEKLIKGIDISDKLIKSNYYKK